MQASEDCILIVPCLKGAWRHWVCVRTLHHTTWDLEMVPNPLQYTPFEPFQPRLFKRLSLGGISLIVQTRIAVNAWETFQFHSWTCRQPLSQTNFSLSCPFSKGNAELTRDGPQLALLGCLNFTPGTLRPTELLTSSKCASSRNVWVDNCLKLDWVANGKRWLCGGNAVMRVSAASGRLLL